MNTNHPGTKPVRQLSVVLGSANSLSMKLRHAAALALMMWVLVAPLKERDFNAGGYFSRISTRKSSA